MAGRPAAARGGNGGMVYGLITFVVLTVASLGAFIWQFSINQGLVDERSRAVSRATNFGTAPSYYENEAAARSSRVATVMNEDIQALAKLITGKTDAVRPAIEKAANRLLTQMAAANPDSVLDNDTLLTALQRQSGALSEASAANRELEGRLAQLQKERSDEIAGFKAAREQFQQQIVELKDEVAKIDQEKQDALAAKDSQLGEHAASNDAMNEELSRIKIERQRETRNSELVQAQLQDENERLQDKLGQIQGPFDAQAILTKSDGKIQRAIPGSGVVYIDLGNSQRIKPGLNFEVFSPSGGRGGQFRGKASIEVINVSELTSECRVTRTTTGRPIVEGDIIVNIAYERNRMPKFVVRGEFDLDYDGQADFDGLDKVVSIIRAWGGQVVDHVDETTDFVLVGARPTVPVLAGSSTVVSDLAKTKQAELAEFSQVINAAQTRYIPVLTQNQFLYLTGYAGQELASIH